MVARHQNATRFIEYPDILDRRFRIDFGQDVCDAFILAVGHVRDDASVYRLGQHAAMFAGKFAKHGVLRLQVVPGRQADRYDQNNGAQTEKFDLE